MKILLKRALLGAVSSLAFTGAANATTFAYSYTAPWSAMWGSNTTTSGSGTITVADADVDGHYLVTAIDGTSKLTQSDLPVTVDRFASFNGSNSTPVYLYQNTGGNYIINGITFQHYDSTRNAVNPLISFGDLNGRPNGYQVAGPFGYTGSTLTFSEVLAGPVPEPASWAMMLGGFGLVGAGMRRRKALVSFG